MTQAFRIHRRTLPDNDRAERRSWSKRYFFKKLPGPARRSASLPELQRPAA
jgi:hypothetical protein